jgi:hypothetical protein
MMNFRKTNVDGAFSANAMTNDIGRADNRILSARTPFLRISFQRTFRKLNRIGAINLDLANRVEEILTELKREFERTHNPVDDLT